MSERGHFRGGGRGGAGGHGGNRGGRGGGGGGGRGGRDQQSSSQSHEKPKKENILDLTKYVDRQINVKFNGGREIIGTLKGYDQLMNLVLDDVKETMRGFGRLNAEKAPRAQKYVAAIRQHQSVLAATDMSNDKKPK